MIANTPSLFAQPHGIITAGEPQGDFAQRAADWMRLNPEAVAEMERLALDAASRGRRFGWKLVAEVVRWNMRLDQGAEGYGLNNVLVAYIGRALVARHPHLAEFVEMRRAKHAKEKP
jgi:GNAT superfamily N-acetyltransferase